MAKIIVVTSGKGGVGKTTTSASFATGLALRGMKSRWVKTLGWASAELIRNLKVRSSMTFSSSLN